MLASELRRLAMEGRSLADAEVELRLAAGLEPMLRSDAKLRAAWDRGRLLRNVRMLAGTAVTVSEAAAALSMDETVLGGLLEQDLEVADAWHQARLGTTIAVKAAMVAEAKKGKPGAVRQVESILRREVLSSSRTDLRRLSQQQMVEVAGVTRQALHLWETTEGMPRNSDGSYDLVAWVKWFEQHVERRLSRQPGKRTGAETDPLRAARAEEMELRIQEKRGQLLDRHEVIAGLVARLQALTNAVFRKAEPAAQACVNQPAEIIIRQFRDFGDELIRSQREIPEELRLPPAAAEELSAFLASLQPEGQEAASGS
jgi:hypothetical protein